MLLYENFIKRTKKYTDSDLAEDIRDDMQTRNKNVLRNIIKSRVDELDNLSFEIDDQNYFSDGKVIPKFKSILQKTSSKEIPRPGLAKITYNGYVFSIGLNTVFTMLTLKVYDSFIEEVPNVDISKYLSKSTNVKNVMKKILKIIEILDERDSKSNKRINIIDSKKGVKKFNL